MPIQIEVHDSHAQLLIEFYVSRLKLLREEIQERERESKEINGVIQQLKKRAALAGEADEIPTPLVYYNDKWTWLKKIHFALEQRGKALSTKEIVDTLADYEPTFLFDRKRAIASISSVLSVKSGAGKDFLKVDTDSGEFAYAINDFPPDDDDIKQISYTKTQQSNESLAPIDDLPF